MFGKKGSNTSAKPAPKPKAKEEAPTKKIDEADKKSDEPAATGGGSELADDAVKAPLPKPDKDKAAEQLAGLTEALAQKEDEPEAPKEKAKAKPKPKAEAKAEPAEEKQLAPDPFAEDLASMEAEAESVANDSDSISSLRLQRARNRIWLDLRDGIDLKALANMEAKAAREEVLSAVEEIARFRNLDLTPTELQSISKECADDMLGFGPLEELLERDDIADIMINGPETTYIEVDGKIDTDQSEFSR